MYQQGREHAYCTEIGDDKKSFIFSNYILDNLKETRSKQYKKKCPKQHKLLNKINDNSPISHLLSIIRNH